MSLPCFIKSIRATQEAFADITQSSELQAATVTLGVTGGEEPEELRSASVNNIHLLLVLFYSTESTEKRLYVYEMIGIHSKYKTN